VWRRKKREGRVKETARSKHEKDRWRMVEERRECVTNSTSSSNSNYGKGFDQN
jgi:hypothetical protein